MKAYLAVRKPLAVVGALCVLLLPVSARAITVRGDINGWGVSTMANNQAFANDPYWSVTLTSTATRASSGLKFDLSGNWATQWGSGTKATNAVANSVIGQAHGNLDGSSPGNLTWSETSGRRYTVRLAGESNWWYRPYVIMQTTNFPVSITTVSDNNAAAGTNPVTVTATLSAAPSGEKVYVRYTTNDYASMHILTGTVAGSTATATIPAQTPGRTVKYYVLTSAMPSDKLHAEPDLCTLRANINGGPNYAYTVDPGPVTGNCWHYPNNLEPGAVPMRSPLSPPPGFITTIRVGNYQVEADMTGGAVYYRRSGDATWATNALVFDVASGNNNYWKTALPGSVITEGETLEYFIRVDYGNGGADTTWIGATNAAGQVKYLEATSAAAHPFEAISSPPMYAIHPASGPFTGGNSVLVTNCIPNIGGGSDITTLFIGGLEATITGQGVNWVRFITPPADTAGLKDVVIHSTSAGGPILEGAYTYTLPGEVTRIEPASGSIVGGYLITLSGSNLGNGSDITNVTLAGVLAMPVSQSSTHVVVIAGTAATVLLGDVVVQSTSHGQSVAPSAFAYTKGDQTIDFPAINHQEITAVTALFASASSGLPVSYVVSGSGVLEGESLGFAGPGWVDVVASQNGDANWNPAGQVTNRLMAFEVVHKAGPVAGGNAVTITAGDMGMITGIQVGGRSAVILSSSASSATVVMPTFEKIGVMDVVVGTANNGSATFAKAYRALPSGRIGVQEQEVLLGVATGTTRALYHDGSTLYVGGSFTSINGKNASGIAAWDGADWTNIGYGESIYTFAHDGTNLYAGGAVSIKKWDQHAWTTLGYFGETWGLVHDGTVLYATQNGENLGVIRKYEANEWSIIGYALNNESENVEFMNLAYDGTFLYVGGSFRSINGVSAWSVARWNGSIWSALGDGCHIPGLFPWVSDVLSAGSKLYVTGAIGSGGGDRDVMQWDGTVWTDLAPPGGFVYSYKSLAHDGIYLYVNGNRISRWDGNEWTVLSYRTSNADLVHDGTNLYYGAYDYGTGNHIYKWGPVDVPGVSPSVGGQAGGYPVTIRGMNLCSGTDATNVTICGLPATLLSQSPTQIVVVVQASSTAQTGDVVVQSATYGETVATQAFTYEGKSDQTIDFPALADQETTNTPVLAATASSGLPVTFAVQSGQAVLVDEATLTLTGTGTVVIVGSQPGNELWNPALDVTMSFDVVKATATVELDNLSHRHDGSPKHATATTIPAGLDVDMTYNGSPTAPIAVGSYVVTGTVDHALYQGSASGVLNILPAYNAFEAWLVDRQSQNPQDPNFAWDADMDRDGMTTWDEFIADTNPAASNDYLRIVAELTWNWGNQISLSWPFHSSRAYDLEWSPAGGVDYVVVASNLTASPVSAVLSNQPEQRFRIRARLTQ